MVTSQTPTRAIVIGGSIAGLLAAKALAAYFDDVIVVERDQLPDDASFRGGAPQARHLHVMLERGQRAMMRLLPGLEDDLIQYGAHRMEWGRNAMMFIGGQLTPFIDTDIYTYMITRLGLEHLIRERVRQVANITFRTGYTATGLLLDDHKKRVTGLQIEARKSRHTESLTGNLVVDASGRSSDTPDWLVAAGYPRPEETLVDALVGYSTCWFERPANLEGGWMNMLVSGGPQQGYRSGIIYETEGNIWNVILTGVNADYPPTDLEGFLEQAKTLPAPQFYEALKDAKAISPVYGYRRTNNLWHHYEKMTLPENLLITGDAAISFNPVYGQGMTVAAMDAETLFELLKGRDVRSLAGLNTVFQKELAANAKNPWQMATGFDLRHPLTIGAKPAQNFITRWLERYSMKLEAALATDPVLLRLQFEVMHMRKPPTAFFSPGVIWRVLRHKLPASEARYQTPKITPSRQNAATNSAS